MCSILPTLYADSSVHTVYPQKSLRPTRNFGFVSYCKSSWLKEWSIRRDPDTRSPTRTVGEHGMTYSIVTSMQITVRPHLYQFTPIRAHVTMGDKIVLQITKSMRLSARAINETAIRLMIDMFIGSLTDLTWSICIERLLNTAPGQHGWSLLM